MPRGLTGALPQRREMARTVCRLRRGDHRRVVPLHVAPDSGLGLHPDFLTQRLNDSHVRGIRSTPCLARELQPSCRAVRMFQCVAPERLFGPRSLDQTPLGRARRLCLWAEHHCAPGRRSGLRTRRRTPAGNLGGRAARPPLWSSAAARSGR
eukprot:15446336-Alexandrium_andersonii.AAC.1